MKTKTVKVNVTKTGIRKGEQGSTEFCPIARALKAKGFKSICVHCDNVEFDVYGQTWYISLPKLARKFIERFDTNKKSVKPFTFTLKLV